VIAKVQKDNIFKVCVQNILHVLECKTSMPDCFIDDNPVEMFPLFDQTRLGLGDVMNPAVIHSCSYPQIQKSIGLRSKLAKELKR